MSARRVADIAFWAALVALAAANLVVVVHSLAVVRLWEDEAFNLTVPLNLLRGLGYTSDGTLSGSTLTPFDVRISTGPVVLLPIAGTLATGLDMTIAGRLVPLAFYASMLVALWLLGRRIGGRWAALAAVAAPLTLNTVFTFSPIQGPADILGEFPAAALLVWAMWAMRKRPWLAGLFVGLAIQTKFISLLAIPALTLAVFFAVPGQRFWQRVRRVLPAAATAAAPTLLYELWVLVSLGGSGYVTHLRDMVHFVRSGGQTAQGTTVWQKLEVLSGAWFVPWWIAVLGAALAVAVGVAAVWLVRRRPEALRSLVDRDGLYPPRDITMLLLAAGVGVVTFVAWWSLARHTPLWIRHPAPGLLAFVPVLLALTVLGLRMLRTAPSRAMRVASAIGGGALAVLVAAQVSLHVVQTLTAVPWETLAQQREAASLLAPLDHDRYASPWGAEISIAVLSGAHAGMWDAGEAVRGVPRLLHGSLWELCPEPDAGAGAYLVCDASIVPPAP